MRACVLAVCAVLLLSGLVDAQRYFAEVLPQTEMWSARETANVEFVRRTTSFRDGLQAGRSVSLTNYFLLYGGTTQNNEAANDVWASTSGRAWVWVAGSADGVEHPYNPETFPPWYEAAHCQDSSYRQYRAGGNRDGVIYNDVWTSIDGSRWTEATPAAEWSPVYLASMVGDSKGNVYIAGGILETQGAEGQGRLSSGEVWMSSSVGRTWRQMNRGEGAITNGAGVRSVALLLNSQTDQLIWMTGVNTGYSNQDSFESYLKDVWVSTNQGANFYPVNLNAPYGRRDDANGEITAGGLMVLAGGYQGTGTGEIYNDVWVSANGGYSWGLCVGDAEWDDRRYQMTLLDGDGYLWVMGGRAAGGGYRFSDMWKSTWTFSDTATTASRCKVTIPSCGTGLKCLPNTGNTLVASDGSGVFCDSCPYTFSSQAAAATLITAFLIVFVILFILASGGLIYTYYKLRSAGAPSPIPLPASAQRWWNKSTTGGPIGSSDSGSTQNGDGLYQPLRIRDQV